MDDYSAFYATLGVDPDTDWETLRSHYKRLIGQWHPDRFSGDTASRNVAEERSKQITIAYQILARYRREHGVLPMRKRETETREAQRPKPHADPAPDRVRSQDAAESSSADATPGRSSKSRLGRPRRIALVLFTVIGALYLADRYAELGTPEESPPRDRAGRPAVAAQVPKEMPAENPRESAWIWIGSTLGEVYAAQGIPTSTEGETWYYGKSRIRFARGKVISWDDHPDNPLRIGRDQPVQMQDGAFDVGSTKDEVRAIQGTPIVETDTVWDYGTSRVHFKNNRVVRWEESPMQPLRVAR